MLNEYQNPIRWGVKNPLFGVWIVKTQSIPPHPKKKKKKKKKPPRPSIPLRRWLLHELLQWGGGSDGP
jgi:hypothetical protein